MKLYQDTTWCKQMQLRLDYNNMMAELIGPEQGLTKEDFTSIEPALLSAVKAMKTKRANGGMDWRDLPYNQTEIVKDITNYVDSVKDGFESFVVLGIGGSALGPIAVQQAINHPHYNELSREKRNGYPKLYVVDNIDPEKLPALLDIIDIKTTLFNVVSKSGGTSETMSQFMIIKAMLEAELGIEGAKKHLICTTDAEKGVLRPIAEAEGYKSFIIPAGVGGRFSELTPVGLLPAAMCGIDIAGLLAGAAFMDDVCQEDDVFKNPAFMYATLQYFAMQRGKNISIIMPYADTLKYIGDWYAQLWAESLGKKFNTAGEEVFVGQTPVKALGVTDQHSQVQLYAEGPKDKVIAFMGVDTYRSELTIPELYSDIPNLGFLGGTTHNKLIQTEKMATEYALLKANQSNMTITIPEVNEFTIGQILYFFEVATGFAGELLNINAFDQPGVEEGKNATYAMFGRPGYEEKKAELNSRPAKQDHYIL
jgi:glucose-6-phosphate isomerase